MNKNKRVELFNSLSQEIGKLDIVPARLINPSKSIKPEQKVSKGKKTHRTASDTSVELVQKSTVDVLLELSDSADQYSRFVDKVVKSADNTNANSNTAKVGALVFMSAKNPGGGVLRGSQAQEEDISLVSTWYHQVKGVQGFYNTEQSCMNSDKMLYVDKAFLLKDKLGGGIEKKAVSLIGAAAVNLNGLMSREEDFELNEVYEVMRKRVRSVLELSKQMQITTLVLGAWGGGVFGLDNKRMAGIFAQELSQAKSAQSFVFAILGQAYFDYKEVFERCALISVNDSDSIYSLKKENFSKSFKPL